MIRRFNIWYDELPGTTRFLLFMVMMSAAIFPLQIGLSIKSPSLTMFGLCGLMTMVAIALDRAFGMDGIHKYIAYAMLVAAVIAGLIAIALLVLH